MFEIYWKQKTINKYLFDYLEFLLVSYILESFSFFLP